MEETRMGAGTCMMMITSNPMLDWVAIGAAINLGCWAVFLALRQLGGEKAPSASGRKPGGRQPYVEPEFEQASSRHCEDEKPRRAAAPDPIRAAYALLGSSFDASPGEVTAAYRKQAAQYHPDKVANLGADLQTLAHERFIQIKAAYELIQSVSSAREANGRRR
jgi:hypothetical protein